MVSLRWLVTSRDRGFCGNWGFNGESSENGYLVGDAFERHTIQEEPGTVGAAAGRRGRCLGGVSVVLVDESIAAR